MCGMEIGLCELRYRIKLVLPHLIFDQKLIRTTPLRNMLEDLYFSQTGNMMIRLLRIDTAELDSIRSKMSFSAGHYESCYWE